MPLWPLVEMHVLFGLARVAVPAQQLQADWSESWLVHCFSFLSRRLSNCVTIIPGGVREPGYTSARPG
jgi:hypothetical protein